MAAADQYEDADGGAPYGFSGTSPITVTNTSGNNWSFACPTCATASSGGLFQGNITLPTQSGTGLTTAFNHSGTYTATDTSIGIAIADTTASGTSSPNFEGQLKAYPGSAFTATALFSLPPFQTSYFSVGLTAMTSTSGHGIVFRYVDNGGTLQVDSYNNASPTANASADFSAVNLSVSSPYIWMRYKDDGTNYIFSVSEDGSNWYQIGSRSKSSSYLGGSGFNYIGVYINTQTTTTPVAATLMSWTITTP